MIRITLSWGDYSKMSDIKFDNETGYLLKPKEKSLLKYIKPDCFIFDAISKNKSVEEKLLVDYLQDELHELLNSFLNGGFSNKGFLFYPLVKDISQENKEGVMKILRLVDYLKNKGFEFLNFEKSSCKGMSNRNLAAFAGELSKDLNLVVRGQRAVKKTIKVLKFDGSVYKKDMDYLKPVFMLKNFINKKLSKSITDFHVHGSIATNDYVKGFSDFDTLIILNKSSLNLKNLTMLRGILYKSRRFLYHIDPLQHHGHMIITDYDLDYYCQTYFPLELFKYSKSFTNNKILKFKVRDSKIENTSKFFWFVNYFRELNLNKKKVSGCYSAKFLLHAITLFPTLYLQAKGIHTYKRYSFNKAKKDFPDHLWNPIEMATSIRKHWKAPKNLPLVKSIIINPLLGYQLNARYWDMTKSILKKNNLNILKLSAEMLQLSETAWGNIKSSLN